MTSTPAGLLHTNDVLASSRGPIRSLRPRRPSRSWPAPVSRPVADARPTSSPFIRDLPLRYARHIVVGVVIGLVFAMALATVGDPMVAAMLALLSAIAPVSLLWGDRANARHRS